MTLHRAGCAGVTFGAVPGTKAKRPKRKASKSENKREQLEQALDQGLKETFPASDAVALTEPASTPPNNTTASEPDTW